MGNGTRKKEGWAGGGAEGRRKRRRSMRNERSAHLSQSLQRLASPCWGPSHPRGCQGRCGQMFLRWETEFFFTDLKKRETEEDTETDGMRLSDRVEEGGDDLWPLKVIALQPSLIFRAFVERQTQRENLPPEAKDVRVWTAEETRRNNCVSVCVCVPPTSPPSAAMDEPVWTCRPQLWLAGRPAEEFLRQAAL